MMQHLNRLYKWPYNEPDKDYPLHLTPRRYRPARKIFDMSIQGNRRYQYRGFNSNDEVDQPYSSYNEAFTGPPPGAINVRSYTLPQRRSTKREPIMIVPPKREPRYITMEVKDLEQPPIYIMPPEPPKKKVIEYEVEVQPKPQEPILVPVQPPPPKPEYVTVRHVVEEGAENEMPIAIPTQYPTRYQEPLGPIAPRTRIPEVYERRRSHNTLLGVRRTLLWELVLASFILFLIMFLIAIFVAGFLSTTT